MYLFGKLLALVVVVVGGSYGTYHLAFSSDANKDEQEAKTERMLEDVNQPNQNTDTEAVVDSNSKQGTESSVGTTDVATGQSASTPSGSESAEVSDSPSPTTTQDSSLEEGKTVQSTVAPKGVQESSDSLGSDTVTITAKSNDSGARE